MTFQNKLAMTCSFKFTAKLFEFLLTDASTFFAKKNLKSNIDDKMKTGFANFLNCLNLYLQEYNITSTDEDKVTIYGSVTLENGTIMRAISSFHNRSWFSNIFVHMNAEELFEYLSDEGHICYG